MILTAFNSAREYAFKGMFLVILGSYGGAPGVMDVQYGLSGSG